MTQWLKIMNRPIEKEWNEYLESFKDQINKNNNKVKI
jgi:hypothetical protein